MLLGSEPDRRAAEPTEPQAALGYDEGTVVIKLGSEARC